MTLNAELTKRENEVAELLACGAAKKEVAGRRSEYDFDFENFNS